MSEDLYIIVPNWDGPDGFQHYKERDPIWIKNYTRLLSHDAYGTLSYHLRGILHGIWMEYARSNRQLRGDTLTLTRRLGHRVMTRDIEALNRAGFIHLSASNTISDRYQDASPHARPPTGERHMNLEDKSKGSTEANYEQPPPPDEPEWLETENGTGPGFSIQQITPQLREIA